MYKLTKKMLSRRRWASPDCYQKYTYTYVPILGFKIGLKISMFLMFNAINELFHYAHRVGHVILTRFPPLDAQNDPVGSRL